MTGYQNGNIQKMRFWCQKILPLVYDNSLSYYEVLCQTINTLNELIDEVDNLRQNTNDYTDAEIKKLRDYLDSQIAIVTNYINQLRAYVDSENETLRFELTTEMLKKIAEVEQLINNFYNELTATVTSLRRYVDMQDTLIYDAINAAVEKLEKEIQEIVIGNITVINPINNTMESLQNTLDSMYKNLRCWGLKAVEYDTLRLTAAEYDSKKLTAYEYDYLGKWYLKEKPAILKWVIERTSGYSPFSGVVKSVIDIIYEIAGYLRSDSLSASEYDAKGLTATDYDSRSVTAYNYDWHGKSVLN